MDSSFINIFLILILGYMAVQVRGGNTDLLGKDILKSIQPDKHEAYCHAMFYPLLFGAIVELIDLLVMTNFDIGLWEFGIIGTGIIVMIIWIAYIHNKYKIRD